MAGRGGRVAARVSQKSQSAEHSPEAASGKPERAGALPEHHGEAGQAGLGPPGFSSEAFLDTTGPPGFSTVPAQPLKAPPGLEQPLLPMAPPTGTPIHSSAATGFGPGLPLPPGMTEQDLDAAKDTAEESRLYDVDSLGPSKQQKARMKSARRALKATIPSNLPPGRDTSVPGPPPGEPPSQEPAAPQPGKLQEDAGIEDTDGIFSVSDTSLTDPGSTSAASQRQKSSVGLPPERPEPETEDRVEGMHLRQEQERSAASKFITQDFQEVPIPKRGNGIASAIKQPQKAGTAPTSTVESAEAGSSEPPEGPPQPPPEAEPAPNAEAAAPEDASDSDDSLIIQELRPQSPVVKGSNARVSTAEEALSTAPLLSKSLASSLPAAAMQAVPPLPQSNRATTREPVLGASGRAVPGDASKASKPNSYSWKLGSAPASSVPPQKASSKEAPAAANASTSGPQRISGQRSYKWQLSAAAARPHQTANARRAARHSAAVKSRTWRRNDAASTPPPSPPLPPETVGLAGLEARASEGPWSGSQPSGHLPAPHDNFQEQEAGEIMLDPNVMLDSERQIACAGHINPVWQAS